MSGGRPSSARPCRPAGTSRRASSSRSRVELYNENVTAEQIDKARASLEERRKKQELARTTLEARQDPTVRVLLDTARAALERGDLPAARSALARIKSPRFAAEREELRRVLLSYQDAGAR